jgi:hypothetical protein
VIPFSLFCAFYSRSGRPKPAHEEGEMANLFLGKKTAVLLAILVFASMSTVVAGMVGHARVEARDTNVHTVWASSGSSRVVVDGDGDTDLDCYVYDRFGNLLGADDDLTDYCIVDFRQRTSGDIRVEIRNLGNVWNAYRLEVR